MRKKEALWTLDQQGGLRFPLRERQIDSAYKPDSMWERPIAGIIVMLVCGTLDFVVFKQLFAAILYDQLLIQWLSVIGCLVAFDLAPVYLGVLLKKNSQGIRINMFAVIALSLSFIIVLIGNVWLRVTVKDILVPSDSAAAFSIFSASDSGGSNAAALPYAIFSSALPLATSVVSFIVSYMSTNPLMDRLKRLRARQVELENAIGQVEALLTEYDEDADLRSRLESEDEVMFNSAAAITYELGFLCADYVRERIKEHLGDAPAANELSKDCRDRLVTLLTAVKTVNNENADVPDHAFSHAATSKKEAA